MRDCGGVRDSGGARPGRRCRCAPHGAHRAGERGSVAIFYYTWYGTPARDGAWQHWDQGGRQPPATVASGLYPARGAYSSTDPSVVRAQMREIAAAGVDTVIVSWWGPGSVEDARLPLVAGAARAAGLRVAVHVEPFGGRTRDARAGAAASRRGGVHDFYVYDSGSSPDETGASARRLDGVRVFANTCLPGKAPRAASTASTRTTCWSTTARRSRASARPHAASGSPALRPSGRASTRGGRPATSASSRGRGARYDGMWRSAVRARADIVTITSYNEWHEGTQIEPARGGVPGYRSYEGAWGAVGRAAERAYLDRTARWAARYRALVARA